MQIRLCCIHMTIWLWIKILSCIIFITSRAYMKQSWKFLQYEQIFSTVQQNLWNSPFTMAIRCPGYGDVTWIEPMVVINSQRNRTFDGCTVMYGNQSVSKISLWCCSVPNLLTGKCSQCWICVFTECGDGFEWSDMISLLKFARFQGRNNGYSYAASGAS